MNVCLRAAVLAALTCSVGCQAPFLQSAAREAPELPGALATARTTASRPVTEAEPATRTPDDADLTAELLQRGHAAFLRGDAADARHWYRQVLQHKPGDGEAQHRLAVLADKRGDFAAAETHYLAAIQAKPADPDLHSDLGYSYLLQGRYDDSERMLQKAVGLNPVHARARNNLGLLYGTLGDYDRALAMFRQAGSERDAQARIAQLFPHGRPHAPDPRRPEQRTVERAEWQSPEHGGVSTPPGGDLTMRIKQEMERARLESEAARRRPEAADPRHAPGEPPPHVMADRAPWPAAAQVSAAEPSPRGDDSAAAQAPAAEPSPRGPVATHDINRRFAEIDAQAPEPYPHTSARMFADGSESPRPVPEAGYRSAPHAAPRTVQANPLDAMELWPPANRPDHPHTVPRHFNDASPSGFGGHDAHGHGASQSMADGARPAGATGDDARRAATLVGMNAGPDGLFPLAPRTHASVPMAPHAFSGTDSRVNGAHDQPPASWHPDDPAAHAPPPGYWSPHDVAAGEPLDAYEAQRRHQDAVHNDMLRRQHAEQQAGRAAPGPPTSVQYYTPHALPPSAAPQPSPESWGQLAPQSMYRPSHW